MDKQFYVSWKIDIWAESPTHAAREALKIQRDQSSQATIFNVSSADKSNSITTVDLLVVGEGEDS